MRLLACALSPALLAACPGGPGESSATDPGVTTSTAGSTDPTGGSPTTTPSSGASEPTSGVQHFSRELRARAPGLSRDQHEQLAAWFNTNLELSLSRLLATDA